MKKIFEQIDELIGDSFKPYEKKGISSISLIEGDRRDVAVLFADVSGFTSISEKLDPEKVKILADKLMQILTVCVKKCGGIVDKYEGDRIMALFGAKKASEKDAEKAVLSGLEMIGKIKAFNEILKKDEEFKEFNLSLRIGVNYGLVTTGRVGEKREGDFTVYGDTVNMASRLEENAPLDGILVPALLKEALFEIFEFEPHGELILKGKTGKHKVFSVQKHRVRSLPDIYADNLFVDRREELSQLLEILPEEKAKNRGKNEDRALYFCFIIGQQGIGKSRLVAEFANEVMKKSRILFGNFSPIKKEIFGVFGEIYREQSGMDPRCEKEAAAQALLDYYKKTLSDSWEKNKLLIFILEDFHEADETEISFLERLLESLKHIRSVKERFLFIVTSRDEIKNSFGVSGLWVKEIRLKPLVQKDSVDLLESVAGKEKFEESLRDQIIKKAEGNPLFLVELGKMAGKTSRKENLTLSQIPSSLKSLMLSRLDSFDEMKKLNTRILAASGDRFEKDIAGAVMKKFGVLQDSESIFSEMETEGLIYRTGIEKSKFTSIFFREVVYETLLMENRKMIHAAYAKELEERRQDRIKDYLSEILYHWLNTDDRAKTLEYLGKTGKLFMMSFDNIRATDIFTKLEVMLDERENPLELAECLLNLSKVMNLTGKWSLSESKAGKALEIIEKNNFFPLEGTALLCLARVKINLNKIQEAETVIQRALAFFKKRKDSAEYPEALSLKGELALYKGEYSTALKSFRTNLRKEKTAGYENNRMKSYFNVAQVFLRKGVFKKSLIYNLKALKISERMKDKPMTAKILANLGISYRNLFQYDEAFKAYKKSLKIASDMGSKKNMATAYGNMAALYLIKDDMNNYLSCLREYLLLNFELKDERGIAFALAGFGNYHSYSGRNREALLSYGKALNLAEKLEVKVLTANVFFNLASLYFKDGKMTEALELINKSADIAQAIGNRHWVITCDIFRSRIQFSMAPAFEKKVLVFRETEKILDKTGDKILRAEVLYRLWEFLASDSDVSAHFADKEQIYKKEALALLKGITKKQKRKELRERIENMRCGKIVNKKNTYSLH
ncbi:tetratricopeptide repeat protein [candidate division WOR-3 bacterium]|nr:tetratricopeptide repeat protein [candidate division WOR-3 bacterium]